MYAVARLALALALPAVMATASIAGAAPYRSAQAGPVPATEPAQLLALINAHRATHGLRPVTLDDELTAIAQPHTEAMVKANRLFHNDALFTRETHRRLGIKLFGENVGYGASVADNHDGFLASKLHHDNIDNPAFALIGIGVAHSADGRAWVTEDFGSARTAPPPSPAPSPTASPRPQPRPSSAPPAAAAPSPRRPRPVAAAPAPRRPSPAPASPAPVASPAALQAPSDTSPGAEPQILAAPQSPARTALVIPVRAGTPRSRAGAAGLAAALATAAGLAVTVQLPAVRRRQATTRRAKIRVR